MTEKLYYTDSHMDSFEATVLSCDPCKDRYAVELDRTAFFPEGGGQTADTGTLNDAVVFDVQACENRIIHYTDKPFSVGEKVHGVLDYEQRFRKMQNHSGEHIVSGIVHKLFHYDNVGFHLGDGDVTVDYNGVLTRDDLDRVETLANCAVTDNLEIRAQIVEPEQLSTLQYRAKLALTQDVRIVTIGDIDCCACCAPHVQRTGEIGQIKILDFEHYKGGVRLHMLCGVDATQDYRQKYENILRISNLLRVPQTETADAVERLLDTLKNTEYTVTGLKNSLAESALTQAETVGSTLCVFVDGRCDADSLRHAVNIGVQDHVICAGFLPLEDGFSYCISAKDTDLRAMAKDLNTTLHGRGGGQATMIRGTVKCSKEEINSFFVNR